MKESHHQKDGNLEYRLNFDGHPRKESTELKMQLTIKLPKISKDTTVAIDLISFGDPCHENCFGNPDKKCVSDGLIANNFTGACKCIKEGYSGDKCTIVNQCTVHKPEAMAACKASEDKELDDKCRNNREDNNYECVCSENPMQIWDKLSKTCKEDPQNKLSEIKIEPQENTKTKTSKWSYNLEFIRKDYYDICFHMELKNKNDFVGTLSLALQSKDSSTNIELISSQTLIHHQKVEKLIDLCLGNFIDLDSFQIAKWDLEIKVNTDSELIWEKNDLSIYGNKKPETKSQASQNAFPEKVQNNLYTLTHNQQNEQTLKINVPMSQNGKVNVNAYIISDWIVNNKSINAEKIKRNILKVESSAQSILHADVYICQPRTGNKQLDCQLYNEGSLPEILPSLSGNKFQIKLHLHTDGEQDQTSLANLEVTTKISFWEPCQLVEQDKDGCHNHAKCEVDQTNGFKCVNCDRTKYLGDRCQYDKNIICNPNAENICKNIDTKCTVNEEGTGFKCVCHKGYVFNSQTNKCDRMKVNNLEWTCTPGKCFINGITGEDFVYLPRYFPSLDKTETSKSNSLYFTTATDSRLSVSVSELDPSKAATQDVCIQFKYFIGPNSSLTVRFNDQLDLLTIDGNVSPLGLSLPMTTTVTKVCIRAYLPPGKMVDLTDVNLALITRIADTDEAVALELVSFTVGEKYHNVETISLPEHGLNYLTRHSVDVEGAPPNAEITYQWPARFPDRWTPTVKGYNYKSRIDSYPDVIGMAILESSWIDRPLKVSGHSAFSKVYLNFKMILRQQIVEENFKVDIYVLDSNRRPIGGVVGTLTNKNFNTKSTPINKEFAIPVSRDIEKGQLYKVQFHIKYKDIQSNTEDTTLFDIEDISFGDPCININEEEKTGDKQVCYNYDEKKFDVVPDSSIKCLRSVKQSGAMDYQCDCQNKNLHGKNCLDADYCQLKHIVSFRQNVAEIPKALKGDDFCVKNVKKAKCTKKVILHDYKFMCLCEEPKQKFNYETQTCDDIDACSLITCKFETEFCKKNATNHANCECKKGFELKEGVCKPVDTESECTVADRNKVSCADPNMKCLYSASGDPFCRCDKGFKQELSKETKDPICVSDMCNFAGLHNCPQGCINTDKEPYYECKCDENSIKVLTKEGTVDVAECQPKTGSPCKEWSGRYKTCIGGVKGCTDNYRLNEKGDDCVPKPTYRMTACPNNFAYRFDEAAKEYACNCKNTSDYFGDDPAMRSTCTITKSICDAEEPGRKLCNARGAGCLVNPLRIDDFTCLCHIGAMFPDVKQHKSASLVRENPKMNCIDVCDLPFKKSQCAAIGAQCNPTKLWLALETVQIGPTTIEEIAAVSYCDCVPGTFYDKNHRSCIQEPKALNLNITFLWSEKLNAAYDEAIEAAYSLFIPELLEDKSVGLEVIDPIGFARVERAAMRLNKEEAAAAEAAWNNQFLFNMLNDEANMLFHIFNLAKAKNQIDQDVQALSLQKVDLNGRLAYTVQLAAKIPESVYLTEPEEAYNSISSEGDELQADATATTVAPTTPTTAAAPTTTGAPTRDTSLNYNLTIYNELINYCASVDDNGKCVITFNNFFESPLYLHKEAVRPILHEPCKYQGACNGMSNCHPLNGSTFECTCGENFEAELRYTFKTRDNNIVYRNEYCKAQDLCASNCLDGEKAHTKCYHRAPHRASITSPWVNEYDCDCVEKYVRQGATNSTCTYVCAQHNCGGDHGECVPSAKSASCKCKDGFYGDHCEHTVGSNTWWIVGIVVLGVLALAAIGAAVFFWRKS